MPRLEMVSNEMRRRHPRALIAGVCAELADRFGLPVWLLRVVVIFAFCDANWTTGICYVAVTVALRTRLIDLLPARMRPSRPPWGDAPADPGYQLQRDRFSALELRLARLEAAVTSDELKLRARFRDIGG